MTPPLTEQALSLGVVILAAGRSARMGRPKLLLPWGHLAGAAQTSVLGHLLAQWRALGARQLAVVLAADDSSVPTELDRLGFPVEARVVNPAPDRGMFSSIQCAARWQGWQPGLTHWALVLGDQPHLRLETLQAVLELAARNPEAVCQPARAGRPRHPVVLPREVFARLAQSTVSDLKEFLSTQVVSVCESADPGLDLDLDYPADYEKALAMAAPQIVVLDGYTLNPGDLTWDSLLALGRCQIHDRTSDAEVLSRAGSAEILLTNKTALAREHLAALPGLRYVGILATGTNAVDLAAARERGVVVTNVPAYSTDSVAQATLALLLELTHGVGQHASTVRQGRWSQCPDFSYWDQPLIELAGLTLGIVGLGRIGQAVARWGIALGMNVVACTPRPLPAASTIPRVSLETLLRQSDVVSLHCPLTAQTRNLIDAQRLSWMKPTAFLLNASRGPLVDENALAQALNHGRLAGAGLDVLSVEPPPADNPLLSARNCLITPHFAWATRAARTRLMETAVANVSAFLRGKPQNVVN